MSAPSASLTRVAQFVHRRPWLNSIVNKLGEWQSKNYRQLGLRYDDCVDVEESANGQLALKRLSAKQSYDRVYRIRRAMQLSLSHKILPREQWTTMKEDVPYITPILEQIKAEQKEKAALDTMEVLPKH